MTNNTPVSIDVAAKLVSEFKGGGTTFTANEKAEAKQFSADKRSRLDARLAKAYGVALSLVGMDAADFGRLCLQEGTTSPAVGENPFSAPIRLLFGAKKDGKLVPDKSAWKYGKCFRAAHSLGWTADDFVTNLDTFKLTVKKGGSDKVLGRLIALETLDAQQNGTPEDDKAAMADKAARSWLNHKVTPLARLDGFLPGYTSPSDGALVGVVLQWNSKQACWNARGVHTDNPDKAWNLISKGVMDEFNQFLSDKQRDDKIAELANAELENVDALLAALEEQNREVRSMEFQHELNKGIVAGSVVLNDDTAVITDTAA